MEMKNFFTTMNNAQMNIHIVCILFDPVTKTKYFLRFFLLFIIIMSYK